MSKTDWQPIKLAPLRDNIILYFPEQMRSWDTSDVVLGPRILIGFKNSISSEWRTLEGEPIEGNATHWMPLPEPPSQEPKP